jgi:DnaJ-class molecular chaperone
MSTPEDQKNYLMTMTALPVHPTTCINCEGQGTVYVSGINFEQLDAECPSCQGFGVPPIPPEELEAPPF